MNEAIRYRENMIKQGKTGAYIKNILQESPPHSSFDYLVDDNKTRINTVEGVHQEFTKYYTKAYSTPDRHKDGIHSVDWSWQTGGDKEEFCRRIQHHMIPQHLTDIIWEAMQKIIKTANCLN